MDLYFQGAAWMNKGTSPEYMTQARGYFERALALDPGNVEALVGMARVDLQRGAYFLADDRAARLAAAEATLTKFLSFAPNHPLAHYLTGLVEIFSIRAAQGIAECERALELDRNLAVAHGLIGFAKYVQRPRRRNRGSCTEALRLVPAIRVPTFGLAGSAMPKSQLGADEEALTWLHRGIEANRNFAISHFFLAAALAQLGRLDEARAAAQAGLALDPSFTISPLSESAQPTGNPTYLAGRERICEGMRKAGLPEE